MGRTSSFLEIMETSRADASGTCMRYRLSEETEWMDPISGPPDQLPNDKKF